MNVVVTGGTGYVGTELVKKLASNPAIAKIVVYDNLSRGNYNLFLDYPLNANGKVRFINGDVLDNRKLETTMKEVDVVFHLAANVTTPFANVDPHLYEQVNHWGTADVAYMAEKCGVRKFIYLSSTSVYGASDNVVTEASVPDPKTYYGISKLRGEGHLRPLMDKMEVLIIRCGNVYGYSHSMRFDAVINKFVFEANYFSRIAIQGDGKQSRPFIHIDTVSNVLGKLAEIKLDSGIYNLVENNYEILDVVDSLKAILPDLEFLFVDQHLKLRTMKVDTDFALKSMVEFPEVETLENQLREFLGHFSFGNSS
jgi:UDP-glucose 4-epimerase